MSSLNIASRALTTNLAALEVIGHNIANVNTDGYSRQRIELQSAGGQFMGVGYFGKGVQIAGVERSYDQFLTREAQVAKSVAASDEIRYAKLQQLENLFPLGDTGLGAVMNEALNAWVDVASSPTDLTARTVAIGRAEAFTARLRDTAASLDELRQSSRQQIGAAVDSVNTLAKQIAALNQAIVEARGSGAAPNDLLDQRDQLVAQINRYVQTSGVEASDGSLTLFVAGSQPLVMGSAASPLQLVDDPLDPKRVSLQIQQSTSTFPVQADYLGGGEIKGLVTFINQDVPDAMNALGRLALSLATQVNQQQRLGLDLNGEPGQDFYRVPTLPAGYAASTNTGTASVGLAVSDPTALQASDYEVRFTGAGAGSVIRLSDGATVNTFSGNPATLTVDGLRLTLAGTAAGGDRFLLQPYATVARDLDVGLSAPEDLAAASPIRLTPNLQPGSGLTVESVYLTAGELPTAPATLPQLAVTYSNATTPGSFTATVTGGTGTVVAGTATSTYSPGQPITFDVDLGGGNTVRYALTLRGSPANSDSFTLTQGSGLEMNQNAGNAKAILALRDIDSFDGVGLADGYVSVFSDVANKVQAGKLSAEFSTTAATTAEAARANVAGVNLDEEAARLIQYQQSYQAAAKYLQVVQGTFDTLMQSFA